MRGDMVKSGNNSAFEIGHLGLILLCINQLCYFEQVTKPLRGSDFLSVLAGMVTSALKRQRHKDRMKWFIEII